MTRVFLMQVVKLVLVTFLIWFISAAISPFFDIYFWFPYIETPINDSLGFQRALTVRSAVFLTLSYFIVSYLRHRKPLSSVVPIMIFTTFYCIFRAGFLAKNGGPYSEWVVVTFTAIFSAMLYFEYKSETNKIFSNHW